jgi:hypothetical protein
LASPQANAERAQARQAGQRLGGEFLKETARVQDVIGIKDPLDTTHDLDGTLTKFHMHKPIFCDANTVFT